MYTVCETLEDFSGNAKDQVAEMKRMLTQREWIKNHNLGIRSEKRYGEHG